VDKLKKHMLITEFFREIKGSLHRFLSILLIVLLGVAFFAGVRAAGPDMKLSADYYYDQSNLQDIRIVSSLGLTDDDIEAIRAISGVKDVEAGYSCDVFADSDKAQLILRYMSLPQTISKVTVKEGRLPEKDGECLVDENFENKSDWKIGDTFSVTAPEDTELSDELSTNTFTIVGIGTTPLYLSLERGSSTIGDGVLSSYVYVPSDTFTIEAYTQAVLTCEGTAALECYSDEYDDRIKALEDEIDQMDGERCSIRYAQIKADGQADIDDARSQIEDAKNKLATAKNKLIDARNQLDDANQEIQDKEKELADGEKEIADKQEDIDNGWQEYNDGYAQYESGLSQLNEKAQELASGKSQLEAAKAQLASGEAQYQQGLAEYNAGLAKWNAANGDASLAQTQAGLAQAQAGLDQANAGLAQAKDGLEKAQSALGAFQAADDAGKQSMASAFGLSVEEYAAQLQSSVEQAGAASAQASASVNQLTATVAQLTSARDQLQASKDQLTSAKASLDSSRASLDSASAEIQSNDAALSSGEAQLEEGREELADAKETLDSSYSQLNDGQNQLDDAKAELEDGKQKLADAKNEIADKEQELDDAQKEYDEQSADAETEISDNEQKVDDAQKDLDELEVPTWYVLNRKTLMSYVEYGQNAERIVAIGNVFPVIFFLVAALVCLTTMTRMVEENREQIGTLKALGYRNSVIAFKYVFYALFATLIGSVIGFLAGQKILPYFIINAYKILYDNLPDILMPNHAGLSISATAAAIGSTMAATIAACYAATRAVPAELMRPRAPKAGKRILLERIGIIWSHLNFSKKATFRNLFRYKKRFFMTILGIGGCMGLLLTGFGLKDSIMAIGDIQFGKVDFHDADVMLDDDISDSDEQAIEKAVASDEDTENYMPVLSETLDTSESGSDVKRSSYVYVISDPSKLPDFVSLHSRLSREEYALTDDGVVVDEKLAKLNHLTAGSEFTIWKSDTEGVTVKVSAVMENYFYHYIYISPAYYQEKFGETPEYNELMVKLKDTSDEAQDSFRQRITACDSVSGINFTTKFSERVHDMLRSMDAIIYVIVIAAGALSFIVLYNLNNINIEERKRELATLKVLGFYESEVSSYVLRENIWLTLIGALLGIIFGLFLHYYVIVTAEIDIMMFGRLINGISYVWSIGLTFLFSMLVNLAMRFRLRKINMVESMKTVE
jgi:putative ABC transport system permease protein